MPYSGHTLAGGEAVARADLGQQTPAGFYDAFIARRRPVVLSGHPSHGAPAPRGAQPGAPPSRKRVRPASPGCARWELPPGLLCSVAGAEEVLLETAAPEGRPFGNGRVAPMRFGDFVDRAERDGGEALYLSAQSPEEDPITGCPGLYGAPARQLVEGGHVPLHVGLMAGLIPFQLNLWYGRSTAGSSSGLHHDFHDNLYVLVRGQKTFRLWSPDSARAMATKGTVREVHPNGLITYVDGPERLADGSLPGEAERLAAVFAAHAAADAVAEAAPCSATADGDDGDAEAALDAALDAVLEADHDFYLDGSDTESVDEAREVAKEHNRATGPLPDNFSTIDLSQSRTALAAQHPGFVELATTTVTLRAGETLYLPAGWFHEVTSSNCGTEAHLAFNYWFHPPDAGRGSSYSPYTGDAWPLRWHAQLLADRTLAELWGGGGERSIVLMGVCGCGKSSVGTDLAALLRIPFIEGDAFHSDANKQKMASGQQLTDDDRRPWLESIGAKLRELTLAGARAVVACSALKREYRALLRRSAQGPVAFVLLNGSFDAIAARLERRTGHFMPSGMLAGQFDTLESPKSDEGVVEVDNSRSVRCIVVEILARLKGSKVL